MVPSVGRLERRTVLRDEGNEDGVVRIREGPRIPDRKQSAVVGEDQVIEFAGNGASLQKRQGSPGTMLLRLPL